MGGGFERLDGFMEEFLCFQSPTPAIVNIHGQLSDTKIKIHTSTGRGCHGEMFMVAGPWGARGRAGEGVGREILNPLKGSTCTHKIIAHEQVEGKGLIHNPTQICGHWTF